MELFKDIVESLSEAIEIERGKVIATRNKVMVAPLEKFSGEQVRNLRNELHMSQAVFASVCGVSNKTVEAWESGKNRPTGPAVRLMGMIKENHKLIDNMVFQK